MKTTPDTTTPFIVNPDLDTALRRSAARERRLRWIIIIWVAIVASLGIAALGLLRKFENAQERISQLESTLKYLTVSVKTQLEAVKTNLDTIQKNAKNANALLSEVNENQNKLTRLQAELTVQQKAASNQLQSFAQDSAALKDDFDKKLTEAGSQLGNQRGQFTRLQDDVRSLKTAMTDQLEAFRKELNNRIADTLSAGKLSEFENTVSKPDATGDQQELLYSLISQAVEKLKSDEISASIDLLDHGLAMVNDSNDAQPAHVHLLQLRAYAKNRLGVEESALRDIDKALELSPNDAFAYNIRGQIYHDLGRYLDAEQDFRRVIQTDPKNDVAWDKLGHLQLKHLNDTPAAIISFDHSLDIDSKSPGTLIERGLAHLLTGSFDAAEQDLLAAWSELDDTGTKTRASILEKRALVALARKDMREGARLALEAQNYEPERLWNTFVIAYTDALQPQRAPKGLMNSILFRPDADHIRDYSRFRELAIKSPKDVAYLRRFLIPEAQIELDRATQPPSL